MNIAIFYSLMFVLAALAVFFIGYGTLLFTLGLSSRNWPAVRGVIESSELKIGRNGDGVKAYWVAARYSYGSGTLRRGSWIGFAYPGTASNSKFNKAIAEALHASLAPGSSIDVFVCPWLPSISVLRRGYNLAAFGYLGISLIFAAVPLWIAWIFWRS